MSTPTVVPTDQARVVFRQPVSTSGFVDAAWWPRSRDLSAELPALLDTLWDAQRDMKRITYNIDAWEAAPRRLQIAGRTVRLGGFTSGDPLVARLTDGWNRDTIDVLVVPADTDQDTAERALAIAGRADSDARAGAILAHARADHDAATPR